MWVQAHEEISDWPNKVLLYTLTVFFTLFFWTFELEASQVSRQSIITQLPQRLQPQSVIRIVPADDPPPTRSADSKLQSRFRVAICLVGGLRAFELSSASLRKNLLNAYDDADIFIHAPVDTDVQKLTLLSGVSTRLASVRLFVPRDLNESNIIGELLTCKGPPHAIQGLLQYFNLVEGCLDLIESYERHNQFKYDWIIRTRIDTYWNAPMHSIQALNLDASKY